MSSPPPPYALQPPPTYKFSNKLPACPPRQSSRQTLSIALQRARHAVQLDSSGSDVPSAIAAYDEAIELLRRVIARRSRKPGNEAEVERVMNIHDRYVLRVRELCRARRLPLPSHVADARLTSRHPLRDSPPDTVSPTSADSDSELSSLLLSASSSSVTSASSVDGARHRHEWIVSEACDEEVKEWGQYLNGGGDDHRASVATAAVWSKIAVSHG
ncbi:hypothetical protein EI94DRAFT_1717865 [Lactarius quietus]|nr:hypothetical protein EI94DRAFT_1750055 [Lactarius quietus]KAF8272737.1 hypothetical protein EI94DRAFT_1717865 [Lactarius quietus]